MNLFAKIGRDGSWMLLVILLQATCAFVFIWELTVSVLGLQVSLIPWGLYEAVEVFAAFGLLAGIGFSALTFRRAHRRALRAERKLRAASQEFIGHMYERFSEWGLTPAETEVALFAIKGLSTAEIATMRNTSDGTVKAQTAAIYRKAGVAGRHQLLSLFIEDLMSDELPVRAQSAA